MNSGIALRAGGRVRARPRARPWPCARSGVAALALCAVVLLAVVSECAAEESVDISAGMGISITRAIKVRLVSPFNPNPRYMVGRQTASAAEPGAEVEAAEVEAAEIVVATNDPKWSLIVRFMLPKGVDLELREAVAQCRLVTPDGKPVSEQIIDTAEVILDGNGRCGEHTLFLEVSGHAEALGIEMLTESTVDIDGWLASEEK